MKYFVRALAVLSVVLFQNCDGSYSPRVEATSFTHSQTGQQNVPAESDQETPRTEETSTQGSSEPSVTQCRPVEKRTFRLSSQNLNCSAQANTTTIFSPAIDVQGRAVARVTFDARNSASADGSIHAWGGQIAVGNPGLSGADRFSTGEPVCNGQTMQARQMLGFGTLDAGQNTVQVKMRMYRSSGCQDQALAVQNALLEVWIEDPQPECQGRDLVFVSRWEQDGIGAVLPLTTTAAKVITATLRTQAKKDLVLISHVSSGSEFRSPNNQCGNSYETAGSHIHEPSQLFPSLGPVFTGFIPPSGGETVGSSRVDLQACKLEYSIVSPK